MKLVRKDPDAVKRQKGIKSEEDQAESEGAENQEAEVRVEVVEVHGRGLREVDPKATVSSLLRNVEAVRRVQV